MTYNFIPDKYNKWMRLARRDIDFAHHALKLKAYNIAAFHAHQAAEKALKALIEGSGESPMKTHVLTELLEQLNILGYEVPTNIKRCCMELEPHYSASRYPDLGPDPIKYYDEWLSKKLINCAESVIKYVEKMAKI